ncbi:MAG TPA: RNA polymerase sigma factor [Anaeromyxobacteraceae bacterium]|nr:RNA polymerase sigma factor [Anaeromyxobacteraceae bacterium]
MKRHHGSIVRLAEAWGHDAQGAEQVARCAWPTILQRLSGFDGAGSLAAWLLRVVSELASATAPRRPVDQDDDDAGAVVDGSTFDPEGRWASSGRPRNPAGTAGDVPPDALRKALAALPACQRVVITLRDVEALGPDDVAAVLGVTVAAQHALLHRARTALVGEIWSGQGPTRETRCTEREGA